MEVDRVLAQIRAIQGATRSPLAPTATVAPTGEASFANVLKQGIEKVNAAQSKSSEMSAAFARGVPGVELPQVMLEMQKASVSFRALTEVRNRFVEAYREIMNMPL
jgi:flagellar hook-basal body complex protein FliE